MQVAFLIPSTTNKRTWESFEETYLNNILLKTLSEMKCKTKFKVFIGYNDDDKIYSKHRINKYKDIEIEWVAFDFIFKGNPCGIWNVLGHKAIDEGFEYFKVLGDDIKIPADNWLDKFIVNLNINNKIGFCAGWSNNDNIPTQFLIHKTHIDTLGFIYPPSIANWFCDDWMYGVYPPKYRYWDKEVKLLNLGGEPRYQPNNDKKLCERLIKRHKPHINKLINQINNK